MAEPVLRMAGLTYRYPDAGAAAISCVELAIEPGEFVVLAGRSGSGKSTLLRAACGPSCTSTEEVWRASSRSAGWMCASTDPPSSPRWSASSPRSLRRR